MLIGCTAQEPAPTPTQSSAPDAAVAPTNTVTPTSTIVAVIKPTETLVPIPEPTGFVMGIVVPTPLPGIALPQNWRLETAVRPEGSGTVELSPPQANQLYFRGTQIEAKAICDRGFLRWAGDVPDDLDKASNPITITMDGPTVIYAFCAE